MTTNIANSEGVAVWSGIEMNMSIFCACLVVMKPLLVKAFPGRFGSKRLSDATFPGKPPSPSPLAMQPLAGRVGQMPPREHNDKKRDNTSVRDVLPVHTSYAATIESDTRRNLDAKQQQGKGMDGIRVHRNVHLSYDKPARSTSGSESELLADSLV